MIAKLESLICNKCSLEEFKTNIFENQKKSSDIENLAYSIDWLNWNRLLLSIVVYDRVDILEFIWDEGFRFELFSKQQYFLGMQSIYDFCCEHKKKEILDFIEIKTNGIKLFTELFRIKTARDYIFGMDNKTILSCYASDLRNFIGVKNFHQSNRKKLFNFCEENNLKYAVLKTSPLDEYNFYFRFLKAEERTARYHNNWVKNLSNKSKGTDFEFSFTESIEQTKKKYIQRHIEWYNTIHFSNDPILSKHSVLIVKKDFDLNSLGKLHSVQNFVEIRQ